MDVLEYYVLVQVEAEVPQWVGHPTGRLCHSFNTAHAFPTAADAQVHASRTEMDQPGTITFVLALLASVA